MIVNFIDISSALWPGFTCTGIVLDDPSDWCRKISFSHEILSVRRATNFLRKNADVIDGVVIIGNGSEAPTLSAVARDIIKPVRWVLGAEQEASDASSSFNNILLMYSGDWNKGWDQLAEKITLGILDEKYVKKGLQLSNDLSIPVETPLDTVPKNHAQNITTFHWLWA